MALLKQLEYRIQYVFYILIIAFGAFVLTYFQNIYCQKINFSFRTFICITALILLGAGGVWAFILKYYDQAIVCICTFLLALTDFISINSDKIIVESGGN